MRNIFLTITFALQAVILIAAKTAEPIGGTRVVLTLDSECTKCQVNRDSVPYAAGVCIYQDGHKFTFDSELVGYTIKIVENEEILYSNLVSPSRLVSVPDSIKGVKGIKLVREEAAYCGVVYFKK